MANITKGVETAYHAAVVELCESLSPELMRCVKCPVVLECKYPKKSLKKLKDEAKSISDDIYDEELDLDNSAENTLRAQNKRSYVYKEYIRDNAERVLSNERCLYERKEILQALQKFVDAGYDITDPRVYMIIKELVSNILIAGRANKAFTSLGVILKKETAAGPVYYQNPLLNSKLSFSRLIVETTEVLDRILKSDEQEKTNKSFTQHLLNELKLRKQLEDGRRTTNPET